MRTVTSLLSRWMDEAGDAPALTDYDGRVWTRGELAARIFALGHGLRDLGLDDGDRVAILDGWSRRHLETDLAVMAAGLVRVPLDPRLGVGEISAQIADAGAKVLVADAAHSELVPTIELPDDIIIVGEGGRVGYETLARGSDGRRPRDTQPAALASLSYTGGTTDRPKAVMLTHGNLVTVLENVVRVCGIGLADTFLNLRPLWPISAITTTANLLGGAHVVLSRFRQDSFGSVVRASRATRTSLVPTHLVRLLDATPDPEEFATLRAIDVGAAAIPPDVFMRLIDTFGARFGVLYGLTEAPWTCYLPPESLAEPATRTKLIRSVGKPLSGYRVEIVGPHGDPVACGQTGEIRIRGENVMQGYWQNHEATSSALSDGSFLTGDLGRIDDTGYVYVVGRKKDVIRTGGRSVLPQEVEQTLLSHRAISEAAVVGVPDREWGEIVKAFLVLRSGESVTLDELAAHCGQRIAGFKKPRAIEIVQSLPKSHYGKVLKDELVRDENGGGA